MDKYPERQGDQRRGHQARHAPRRPDPVHHAGVLRHRFQEQGHPPAAGRGGRLPALAHRPRHHRRQRHQRPGQGDLAQALSQGTVRRPGLQDHQRRLRRPADLHPRLLGRTAGRQLHLQPGQGQARAHRPHPAHPRRQPRRDRRRPRRRHRRPDRHQVHHHRRHPVLREGADAAGEHPLPGDRHRPEDRAAVGARSGTSCRRRCTSCRWKTRPSACISTTRPRRR